MELAFDLHIYDCYPCTKELEEVLNMLEEKGANYYKEKKYKEYEKRIPDVGPVPTSNIKINNDNDLVGYELQDWGSLSLHPIREPTLGSSKNEKEVIVFLFSPMDWENLLKNKTNPYTRRKLTDFEIAKLQDRITIIKEFGVDYKNLLPLSETLDILTDVRKVLPKEEVKFEQIISVEKQLGPTSGLLG